MRTFLLAVLIAVLSAALVSPVLADDMVPFKGVIYARQEAPTPDPVNCPADHPFRVPIAGSGIMSHLGTVTDVQSHCISFDPAVSDFVNGRFTFTASNGDTVFGTYSGVLKPTSTPAVFEIDGKAYFKGGTGRFKGLTGAGIASGTVDLMNQSAVLVLQGAFSSVGAAKK